LADKNVKVYSTPTCPWCRMAKEYLAGKGVEFTDFNVAEDLSKLQEMVEVTGQRGVPIIVIDGDIIVGFDRNKIDHDLAA